MLISCNNSLYISMSLNAEKSTFWQDNALFASKAKINFFEIISSGGFPKAPWSEENFSKNADFSL